LNACEFVLIVRRRHVCGTEVMIWWTRGLIDRWVYHSVHIHALFFVFEFSGTQFSVTFEQQSSRVSTVVVLYVTVLYGYNKYMRKSRTYAFIEST
jgi:hypothetical protein